MTAFAFIPLLLRSKIIFVQTDSCILVHREAAIMHRSVSVKGSSVTMDKGNQYRNISYNVISGER